MIGQSQLLHVLELTLIAIERVEFTDADLRTT